MLEQSAVGGQGNKIMSHSLISHGGHIYIHALTVKRTLLEECPSISEGHGGRVTDYRINVCANID